MNCRDFERVQLAALLGDARSGERKRAEIHARSCEDCRRSASRDRWLEAAVGFERRTAERGFAGAHRDLMKAVRERRAYCCHVDGPFGPVYLARTLQGVCRVSFGRSEEDFLGELEERALLPEMAPAKMGREARQLEDYFSGRCRRFRLPVDLRLVTPFQRLVLEATARIPFGQVLSYGEVARRIGKPRASRAVGGALGRNPVAIVVPCHRVVASDGTIGGYTGGIDIKRKLMRIEGISLEEE